MIVSRRSAFAAIAALAAWLPLSAHAQDYPSRVVQIINPYQAGSTTDVLARGLAAGLSSRLGQQFVVINRPGAGGATGTISVARAEADGHTLLFAPALVVSVYPATKAVEAGYKADALVPVCQTFSNAMVLAVRAESPLRSVADLVKAAQEKPGALNYGHQGPATIPHLAMEEFLDVAKLKITGVAYRGDPGVATDLIGGRLDCVGGPGNRERQSRAHSPDRHLRRGTSSRVPRHADREGARLRRQPDQLRRHPGARTHAATGHRQARAGMRGRGPGRSLPHRRQRSRPAAELLCGPQGVRRPPRA
jgi:tripartite-type tricarboxylate transporter receptor subunit TctC